MSTTALGNCDDGIGQPLSPDAYSQAFIRIAERANLAGFRLHDLRHCLATEIARRVRRPEVTAMLLGHSSVNFTRSTYVHPGEEELDEARAALNAAFGD